MVNTVDLQAVTAGALELRLLDRSFPFADVSALAQADRHSKDWTYTAHKWWARRPPAVIRALVLAACLPETTTDEEFWAAFASEGPILDGLHIGDPFMGGATTLVEAARLGARVTGIDVDPLAVRIARHELAPVSGPDVKRQAQALLEHLRSSFAELYPGDSAQPSRQPLHYFWLRRIDCEHCGDSSLVYRNLVLARDVGKAGGVVRDAAVTAFCPDCKRLHRLGKNAKQLRCCGRRRNLTEGTFHRARHSCPSCQHRSSHEQMVTGRLPRVLIAVEETVSDGRRVLRMPTVHDHHALDRAAELRPPHIAGTSLDGVDGGRPKSYGFATAGDLFSDRQAVVLAAAFAWVESQKLKEPLAQALRLAVSNAIASNNLLCGYATDYGRLAPAFYGVKSYSMPVLAVELNPLHATAGRGTIEATLRRVQRAAAETVRRHRHDSADGEIRPHAFTARRAARYVVRCQSADRRFPADLGLLDAAITDPPYFDFIPYSDLSLLHRAWLPDGARLTGAPIFPVGDEPVTQFAKQLGRAFQRVSDALGQGAPVAFTYHSSHPKAWQGLHGGLRQAKLGVSAIYPVWADGRAASHGHAGNCEWDLVFVCRPDREITTTNVPRDITGWLAELQRWDISTADRESMSLGLGVAQAMSSHGRRKRDELSSAGSGQPRPRSA